MEIGAPFPTFCGGAKNKITIFFLIFAKPYHSHSMHISVFFSDGMYSVLTILCNYLQMINLNNVLLQVAKFNTNLIVYFHLLLYSKLHLSLIDLLSILLAVVILKVCLQMKLLLLLVLLLLMVFFVMSLNG